MSELPMPRLSDSMEEGVILAWLKAEGDSVEVGEELVEIETDKANMIYESDLAGTLIRIIAGEGEVVGLGAPIALIGDPDAVEVTETHQDPAGRERQSAARGASDEVVAAEPAAVTRPPATTEPSKARAKASPLARRVARERDIDLSQLAGGSGPNGRIVKRDVEALAASLDEKTASSAPTRGASGDLVKGEIESVELTRLQRTVARRMSESKSTVPHFYLTSEVNMEASLALRTQLKAATDGPVPSINDMVIKATALALRDHPKANASYRDTHIDMHSRINIGVAVAAAEALVVPTVFDADRLGLAEINAEIRRLATRVREQTVTPLELEGGTFTVSNLGMYGVVEFDPVINTPQAAILAVGSIQDKAVIEDRVLVPGHVLRLTLACDHRILYGAEGAVFLDRIKQILEAPLSLAL